MPMPEDNQNDEFLAAFNEDQPMAAEPSEDEAFGLNVPEDGTPDTGGDSAAVVLNGEAGEGGDMPPAEDEAPADQPMAEGEQPPADPGAEPAAADDAGDDMPTDPKELQRMKSWEGRLRKREEELAAREAALAGGQAKPAGDMPTDGDGKQEAASEAIEQAADQLEADGDAAGAEAVNAVAEKVESGELSADAAMKMLAEDFGDEFVNSIRSLVTSMVKDVAGKEISRLDGTINQMIGEITDERARSHFEAIADAHPDFNEIPQERIEAYIGSLPEDKKAQAEQAVAKGSTRQVIRFLNDLKSWEKSQGEQGGETTEAPEPQAVADAEGVRSTGLRLPSAPTRSDDYDSAWEQF